MIRIMTLAFTFSALTALSACTGYQSVGSMGEMVCNEKGEGVLWAKPNSQGKMDTLKLSKDNC
ncbi:MAG: hypothetical protein ACO3MW_14160 [Rhodospirillales bacterium]